MATLGPWICDVCGDDVHPPKGLVVWDYGPDGDRNFRIIHPNRCTREGQAWTRSEKLETFLGPDGLSYLTSWISLGPVLATKGRVRPYPGVGDMEEFVDLLRRVQIPGYERVRTSYRTASVAADYFEGASESFPYLESTIDRFEAYLLTAPTSAQPLKSTHLRQGRPGAPHGIRRPKLPDRWRLFRRSVHRVRLTVMHPRDGELG